MFGLNNKPKQPTTPPNNDRSNKPNVLKNFWSLGENIERVFKGLNPFTPPDVKGTINGVTKGTKDVIAIGKSAAQAGKETVKGARNLVNKVRGGNGSSNP